MSPYHEKAAAYLHANEGTLASRSLTVDLSNGLASLVEFLVGRQEVWLE